MNRYERLDSARLGEAERDYLSRRFRAEKPIQWPDSAGTRDSGGEGERGVGAAAGSVVQSGVAKASVVDREPHHRLTRTTVAEVRFSGSTWRQRFFLGTDVVLGMIADGGALGWAWKCQGYTP